MSNRILFYDTETSGLPLWNEPSEHPDQPHIVQVAGILLDAESGGKELYDAICRPDGWTIPKEVASIHGITTERAAAEGRPEAEVFADFDALWRRSDLRVAYNESFDARILRIAYMRFADQERADQWKAGAAACAAEMATKIVNLPPTEKMRMAMRTGPKKPKLTEAYQYFFGCELDGAHDAMADAVACMEIYLAITSNARRAS